MSIADEITRLQNAKARLKEILTEKGATLNGNEKLDELVEVTGTFEGGESTDYLEALCNDTLTSYSNSNITKVKDTLFKGSTKLESIDLPNATSTGGNSFSQCTSLENANLPNATSIGSYAFSDDTNLTTVNIPNATSIGSYAFKQCYDLKNINPINVTTISTQAFASCNGLESIELIKITKIDNYGFRWCYALKKVVIEQTDSVCVFGTNVFDACCHIVGTTTTAWGVTHNPDKLKDGYIYVPASLLSQYKVATNLATYESQIIGHQDFNVGDTLPSYANDTYTTCTWYSDETLQNVVTSVATQGRYYCRLEA